MRVNLLGGPCAGKSTTAAWLFSQLKLALVSVELINEYVKSWAYEGRKIHTYDQVYLIGKQMQYEYRFLKNGCKNIVTDSPVCLSVVYAEPKLKPALRKLTDVYEMEFPSVNIFLQRGNKTFVQEGRYHNLEQAKMIDDLILEQIPGLHCFDYQDRDAILKFVLSKIDK